MSHKDTLTPQDVLAFAHDKDVKMVDMHFTDIRGTWRRFAIPIQELSEAVFKDGLAFDGSSIKGWCPVEASDMLIIPDSKTAFIDPFISVPTLGLIGNIHEPIKKERYARCPRGVAERTAAYIKNHSIADTAYFGPEAEFFVFDDVRYDTRTGCAYYEVDSDEAGWNTARNEEPNLGYKVRSQDGYLPCAPKDQGVEMRLEMVRVMQELGLYVEREHHEVATAGQAEIDLRYDTLLTMADNMMIYKYIVRNVAEQHGRSATFMPKPLFGENGSGMHVHVSIWKDGIPLMAGDKYAGISELGLFFIGGLLTHAPALAAICNPTNNSYKRLVPGYEAPVYLAYSARNRSAVCRIPMGADSPKSKRIEIRSPDPSTNPYLCMSAILLAGMDGVEKRIHPGEPMEKNLYHLSPEERAKIKTLPESLKGAIEALEADHEFLTKDNIFSRDLLGSFMELKKQEYDAVRLRPHPYEYSLYYDV